MTGAAEPAERTEAHPALDGAGLRAAFERDGYARVGRLLGARTLASLVRGAEDLVRAGASLEHDATIRGVEYHVQSRTGRSAEGALAPGVFRKVLFPHRNSPAYARLRRDRRVIDLVRAVGLPHPLCVVDQLNLKHARVGTGFPWHQDAPFLPPSFQRAIERHGGANVVIALDAADAGNGALEALAGTHRQGPRSFEYDTAGTNEGVFDESGRTLLALDPGDAVVFHPWLAHGSGPNRSERQRRAVTLWFLGGAPIR